MPKASKNKKRRLFIILGIALVAILGVVIAIAQKQTPPVLIQKEKAARRDLTEVVVANGRIEPVTQVNISPEVSGEIIELPVKEGQTVKKGDLLVRIRPDNYLAAHNSAEANYKASVANKNTAIANLEKADLEYRRNEALHTNSLISDSDYLTAKTAYDVATAGLAAAVEQVAVAKAALDTADADLSKTTIYSPLDGVITKLNSQLGERVVGTAMMAGTEIMTVSDLTKMEARVDVGETDVVLCRTGQVARLEVDAFKDRKFSGRITEVANSSNNSATGSAAAAAASTSNTSQEATKFQVKIRVTEQEAFRPGMSCTADIETRYRTNVIAVPIQCVTLRLPKTPAAATNNANPATNIIQVADNAPLATSVSNTATFGSHAAETNKPIEVVFVVAGDHVKLTPVKRGISDDNYTEIVDGLAGSEEVVTGTIKALNHDLEDGKKVAVSTKDKSKTP